MNGMRQSWLVARREIRERGRSRAFRLSVVLMIVTVAAVLILPALLRASGGAKDVGLTGATPTALAGTIQQEAHAAGTSARVHRYASLAAGEQAVRQGHLDVLLADARRLEWKGQADEQLKAIVTGAINLVTMRERATAVGINPGALAALLAPVPVTGVELGHVAGRTPADEYAVMVMTLVLFFCISLFGAMVLSGVLEEKASRVVEVLLARIPARALLAGKIAGIGLLGLAQIGVTALAALVAVTTVHFIHVPAVRGAVLAWAVVWFVLGYALYATVYGALGSLGSRAEDAPERRRTSNDHLAAGLLRLVRDDRPACQRGRQSDLVLPADRAHGHARADRHGGDRLVGAGSRRRAHPGRHCRARSARWAGLHQRHPPWRATAQPARRLAKHSHTWSQRNPHRCACHRDTGAPGQRP